MVIADTSTGLERGGVYQIDLGTPRGHEQQGRRLGILMSPSFMNWSAATILPTSTSAQPAIFRPRLTLAEQETVVLIDQIRSIDTDDILGPPISHLTRDQMEEVENCLARYLGIIG